jgi:pyrroline-5-carboxylate reductase
VPTVAIEALLPPAAAVVRAMPNTPALVGQAMTVLSPGSSCSPEQLAIAEGLLACVGAVAVVVEPDQDAVTALSGSGPAYVFLVVEALIDAATGLGLDPQTAHTLAVQTVYGAACMLRETGEQPDQLRVNVTSPGGTTAAALEQLDLFNLREAFAAALTAARNRSIELASSQ